MCGILRSAGAESSKLTTSESLIFLKNLVFFQGFRSLTGTGARPAYQLEGDICVKIQEDGEAVEMPLGPGDMFLLPAGVPHSPVRSEGSLGLVIERKREGSGLKDGLMWFCDRCNNKLHETFFDLTNIEKDFQPRFREFYNSESLRSCDKCGHKMEVDSRFI